MTTTDSSSSIIKDDEEIVPLAVLMVMDNINGPVLLGMDPIIERLDFKSSIEFSGLRIFSSMEPLDLVQSGYLHALYPWSHPKGQLACLYFIIDAATEHHDKENPMLHLPQVFLVGSIIDRRFSQVVRWLPDDIINVLEEASSRIVQIVTSRIDNRNSEKIDLTLFKDLEDTFQVTLHEMRENMKSLILTWLRQFE